MSQGLFGLSISASGLMAERIRMQTTANNIANINTTRQQGVANPYQRQEVFFESLVDGGVKVTEVKDDPSPALSIYQPHHPDADDKGYVKKPNIDLHFEMVDLISSARTYQANLAAIKISKEMAQRTINMGA